MSNPSRPPEVQALIEKWRDHDVEMRHATNDRGGRSVTAWARAVAFRQCADDLAAALASSPAAIPSAPAGEQGEWQPAFDADGEPIIYRGPALPPAEAAIPSSARGEDEHAQCHDLVCSGSRKHPRGAKGVSCSCAGRDTAYAELQALRESSRPSVAEMEQVKAALEMLWREIPLHRKAQLMAGGFSLDPSIAALARLAAERPEPQGELKIKRITPYVPRCARCGKPLEPRDAGALCRWCASPDDPQEA